jgi:hypothetical protein
MAISTKTVSIASTAAQLAAEADMISSVYFGLPQEDFICVHGVTSNEKDCILLTSVTDATAGVLRLHHAPNPTMLKNHLPEGFYAYDDTTNSHVLIIEDEETPVAPIAFTAGDTKLSLTPFSFFLINVSTVKTMLKRQGQSLNSMIFPAKKASLSADEIIVAGHINRGNKGAAAMAAGGSKLGWLSGLAKSVLG